ncbi:unnamed protein product, partial [Polarella glacialis]
ALLSKASAHRRLIGLTATLLREGDGDCKSGEDPWALLGRCVFQETFARLAPEYLAPVRCVEIRVPVVGAWRGMFKRQPLAAAVCLSRGKWEMLEHLLAKHAGDSLIILVERCEQARLIAATFGILPIDGTVPAAQLKDYLERFRARKILAIVATHVLDDSADFPELTVMIQMGGHFGSRRQEQQRLGRLLRWGPVKRQRWEANGFRPTFYVLVHKGTVEERMSRHRTSSVLGVKYEKLTAESVAAGALASPLAFSALFPAAEAAEVQPANLGGFLQLADESAVAAKNAEEQILKLSRRVALTLPGGQRRGGNAKPDGGGDTLLADVRRWLATGSRIELRKSTEGRQDGEDEMGSESGFSDSSFSSSSSSSSSSSHAVATPEKGASAKGSLKRPAKRLAPPAKQKDRATPCTKTAAPTTTAPTTTTKTTVATTRKKAKHNNNNNKQKQKLRVTPGPRRQQKAVQSKGQSDEEGEDPSSSSSSSSSSSPSVESAEDVEANVSAESPPVQSPPTTSETSATTITATVKTMATAPAGLKRPPPPPGRGVFIRLQRQTPGSAPLEIDLD